MSIRAHGSRVGVGERAVADRARGLHVGEPGVSPGDIDAVR